MAATDFRVLLICRVGRLLAGLPIEMVIETLRPLPVEPLPEAPAFVAGSAIIRGEPLPVVALGRLLSDESSQPGRFVVTRTGARKTVLSVDAVLGFRDVPASAMSGLPPLLSGAGQAAVSQLGSLDNELLLVLGTASVLPESVYSAIDSRTVAA